MTLFRDEDRADKVFTETAKAVQNFHKTDRTFGKYKNINPFIGKRRIFAARIDKPEGSNKSTWIIPKSKEPGPGTYPIETAIVKTQWGNIHGPIKATTPNVCFVDKYKQLFKHVPGAGTYDKVNEYHKVLHKDTNFKKTNGFFL